MNKSGIKVFAPASVANVACGFDLLGFALDRPGDEIIGYITLGDGIAIHRQDCINVLEVSEAKKSRLVAVNWGNKINNNYSVDVVIKAYNRRGLVRDISAVVAGEDVDIITIQSLTDKESNKADFKLRLELSGIDALDRVLIKIQQIPNIIEVFRVDS